jgi:hypothetical protein
MWDNSPTDQARENLEQQAIARSNQEVQIAAMVKYNLRLQATIGNLAGQVGQAQAAAAAANAVAINAQAVAQAKETWILSVLRASLVQERKEGRGLGNGCLLSKIIFVSPQRQIVSDRRPPIWRVVLGPCGPVFMRRIGPHL